MEKEFVSYELALRMKQLGFDEECFYVKPLNGNTEFFYTPSDYDDFAEQKELEVGMPLFQQAFRWFREKYNLKGYVSPVEYLDDNDDTYHWCIYNECNSGNDQLTCEEAELACLDKLLEIIEKEK